MFFDRIIYGTQYYRTPTPLPEEWEGDIQNMKNFALDAFQIRINWRWNERREGEYDFSDVDRLLALAHQNGRKVIMKFLLECAPQYVFDKYGADRIGPRGERLRGGSHGAFYGGWRPCFENPDVQRRMALFVEEVAKRYADNPDIILWNAWNEIRNKPVEDCFCDHCRRAYGKYLEKKFGTVEAMNAFYGAAEDSFEHIALPAMPHGYWDMYEFKKFKGGESLHHWLRIVYEAVRKYDKVRPIMSHVGFTSAFQNSIGDVCDDYTVSPAVDFWGTSIPCDTTMETKEQRLDFSMLTDFVRSVNPDFFLHEIYPGLGMFKYPYDTPFDMRYKLYSALGGGAKGLIFWQYRAERVGHENDCAGLFRMDGSPREVAFAAREFGEDLHRNMPYFVGAKAKRADAAIVFDFDSMLMSEIEDCCGHDHHFEKADPLDYYRNAHAGIYRLLREKNFAVDYVGTKQKERFSDYKVLYFPYYTMITEEVRREIEVFLKNGGTVIADEGFAMRQPNTWMQPYDTATLPFLKARMIERRRTVSETVKVGEENVEVSPYKTEYRVADGEVMLRFADGTPALQKVNYGKGTLYLSGFSLGYSYYKTGEKAIADLFTSLFADTDCFRYPYADVASGMEEKRLENGENDLIFLFNSSNEEKHLTLQKEPTAFGGTVTVTGKEMILPPKTMGYAVLRKG